MESSARGGAVVSKPKRQAVTLAEKVAVALYNSCVKDHDDYPYFERNAAGRRTWEKQARAAIDVVRNEDGKS